MLVTLDFNSTWDRECAGESDAGAESSDYETWTPHVRTQVRFARKCQNWGKLMLFVFFLERQRMCARSSCALLSSQVKRHLRLWLVTCVWRGDSFRFFFCVCLCVFLLNKGSRSRRRELIIHEEFCACTALDFECGYCYEPIEVDVEDQSTASGPQAPQCQVRHNTISLFLINRFFKIVVVGIVVVFVNLDVVDSLGSLHRRFEQRPERTGQMCVCQI